MDDFTQHVWISNYGELNQNNTVEINLLKVQEQAKVMIEMSREYFCGEVMTEGYEGSFEEWSISLLDLDVVI